LISVRYNFRDHKQFKMTHSQQSLSQFDIMMKLAQETNGIAKMFDPASRFIPQLPQNNYIFDKVEVTGSESESRQGNRDQTF